MDKETLRMQMLSGVITESEYKEQLEEKESLNEHFVAGGIVGIGAINQIPSRTKEVYEDAFEHFLKERYETKFENREQDLNENEGNGVEEFLDGMINMSIPEDAEEGEKVSGVWEANEYADEDSYGEAANEFKSAHQYILDNGGTITIEGNPDVNYTALDNGDIKYDLTVTLDEGKEVEEPNNY